LQSASSARAMRGHRGPKLPRRCNPSARAEPARREAIAIAGRRCLYGALDDLCPAPRVLRNAVEEFLTAGRAPDGPIRAAYIILCNDRASRFADVRAMILKARQLAVAGIDREQEVRVSLAGLRPLHRQQDPCRNACPTLPWRCGRLARGRCHERTRGSCRPSRGAASSPPSDQHAIRPRAGGTGDRLGSPSILNCSLPHQSPPCCKPWRLPSS
jgi:hypothetical protein